MIASMFSLRTLIFSDCFCSLAAADALSDSRSLSRSSRRVTASSRSLAREPMRFLRSRTVDVSSATSRAEEGEEEEEASPGAWGREEEEEEEESPDPEPPPVATLPIMFAAADTAFSTTLLTAFSTLGVRSAAAAAAASASVSASSFSSSSSSFSASASASSSSFSPRGRG